MSLQKSIENSQTVKSLRENAASVVENVIAPAKDDLVHSALKAKDAAGETARQMQQRAGELGEAASQRGGELVADLAEIAVRSLRLADTNLRSFARRKPEVLIAGSALAAILGIGLVTWLRASKAQSDK